MTSMERNGDFNGELEPNSPLLNVFIHIPKTFEFRLILLKKLDKNIRRCLVHYGFEENIRTVTVPVHAE